MAADSQTVLGAAMSVLEMRFVAANGAADDQVDHHHQHQCAPAVPVVVATPLAQQQTVALVAEVAAAVG